MNLLENMTRKYPLQKTLCFELCPVGRTKENFEKSQDFEDSILASLFLSFDNFKNDKIVEDAQQRSDEFRTLKHLIDPIHVKNIEDSLTRLANDSKFIKSLSDYEVFEVVEKNNKKNKQYKCPTQEEIKKNKGIQKDIKHRVREFLTNNEQFEQMFFDESLQFRTSNKKEFDDLKKKFFEKKCKILQEHYKDDPAKVELIKHFTDFMSYFNSYDNRVRNLYESEEKISTIFKSIPYRLITDNLPIFYVNTIKLDKITKKIKIVLPDESIKYVDKFSLYLTNSSIKRYNRIIGKINTAISKYNSNNPNKLSHLGKLGLLVDLEQDFDILKRISDDKELVEIINEFINRIKFQNEDDIQSFKDMFKDLDKKYDIDELYIRNNKDVKDIFVTEIKEILRTEIKSTLIAKYKISSNNLSNDITKIGISDVLKEILRVKYNISNVRDLEDIIDKFFNTKKYNNPNDKNTKIKDRLKNEIKDIFRAVYNISNDEKNDKKDDNILKPDQYVKFGNIQPSYVSFEEIKNKIAVIKANKDKEDSKEVKAIKNNIKSKIFVAISNRANKLFDNYLKAYENVKDILNREYKEGMKTLESKNSKNLSKIKKLLDSIKAISDFVSYFVPKNSENRDFLDFYKVNFDIYNKFNPEKLAKINQIYAHVKAYFTLKNFSTKKIRLNFGIESFLDTWEIEQIDENLGTILLKEEAGEIKYFLGIVNRRNFSKFEYVDDKDSNAYRQMIYKYVSASKNDGQTRKIEFKYISKDSIDKMVEKEELYLFQIYRKDFSKYSNGNFKLHTMYWNNIFDEDNLEKEHIFSISGEARIFYRAKSLPEGKITHPKGDSIKNKNVNNPKKESKFAFDLIKDRRYTANKLMFHVPIAINYNAKDMKQKEFNNIINKRIQDIQNKAQIDKNQDGINIIAVTRAEKELLYYLVMNSKMDSNREYKILEQGALNQIKSKANNSDDDKDKVVTDYKEKYDAKKAELTEANEANNNKTTTNVQNNDDIQNINNDENIIKEWKSERSIKDFLDGYISQAVNEIVKLVRKYNAIVVFEDLEEKSEKMNSILGKSLYYKLEKALIAKLSYLADKHKTSEDKFKEGSTFNAYQLAFYDEEKKSDEKQNGIVFYVPTTLTTNIDPKSKFMNCFSNKISDAPVDVRDFVDRFESIIFNEEKQYYEFKFKYNCFLVGKESQKFSNEFTYLNKLYKVARKDEWTICSYGDRQEKQRNNNKMSKEKYIYKSISNLTKEFQDLFTKYNIRQGKGLKRNITNFLDDPDKGFASSKPNRNPNNRATKPTNPKEEFCKEFIRLFKLMVQMKNTDGNKTYIISPVEKDGVFYDSRKVTEFSDAQQSSSIGSVDESSCRAYNIAKKGLMILDKIKEATDEDKLYNIDLTLDDEDWINYVDNKPIR